MIIDPYRYARAFNPADYGTAVAWYSDTGSDPSIWPDLSGNGNDATQATMSKQPAIVAAAQNGRQVRRFDGVDDTLTTPTISALGTNHAVFAVLTHRAYTSGDGYNPDLGYAQSGSATDRGAVHYVKSDGTGAAYPHYPNGSYDGNGTYLLGTFYQLCLVMAPSWTVYKNGVVEGASSATLVAGIDLVTMGAQLTGSPRFSAVDIAEIIICSAVSDRAGMEAALMAKWGITP